MVIVSAVSLLDSAGGVCGCYYRSPFLSLRSELFSRFLFLGWCGGRGLFWLGGCLWLPRLVLVGGGLCPPRCFGFGLWCFCGLAFVGGVGVGDRFLWLFCLRALAFWCFSTVLMMVSSGSLGFVGITQRPL